MWVWHECMADLQQLVASTWEWWECPPIKCSWSRSHLQQTTVENFQGKVYRLLTWVHITFYINILPTWLIVLMFQLQMSSTNSIMYYIHDAVHSWDAWFWVGSLSEMQNTYEDARNVWNKDHSLSATNCSYNNTYSTMQHNTLLSLSVTDWVMSAWSFLHRLLLLWFKLKVPLGYVSNYCVHVLSCTVFTHLQLKP